MLVKQLNIDEEQELVIQLQDWQPLAWKRLVTEYGPCLKRCIRRSLREKQLDNALQNEVEHLTWQTLVEQIDDFMPQPDYRLLDWLNDLQAQNITQLTEDFSFFRQHQRLCNHRNSGIPNQETRREVFSALDLVIERLLPAEREIVLQHFVQQMTADQLARRCCLEASIIEQILVDARQQLHDYLLASDLFLRAQSESGGD